MSDFTKLETGAIHWFADWPIRDVPRTGAIVYTIWDKEGRFIYVGMAGPLACRAAALDHLVGWQATPTDDAAAINFASTYATGLCSPESIIK